MRKALRFTLSFFNLIALHLSVHALEIKPDTVKVGIYVTSIHDIDFKQKEFTITFWLWLKYKNKDFDFTQNLEIPQAKTVTKSFSTVNTTNGTIYMQLKLQCIMKDSWKIEDFPFDKQKLRLGIENSQYDSKSLIFVADSIGKHYDTRFALNGWNVDTFLISTGRKLYETGFGDTSLAKPRTEYSAFRVRIAISRDSGGLFWKMFIGMYIAFLIAYICFYIHSDSIDSRFGLSVGALFGVIGNKYIVDSALPESTSFTLVDTLHGLTLAFIFMVITSTAYSLKLVKEGRDKRAKTFNMTIAQALALIYIILNIYFISEANR